MIGRGDPLKINYVVLLDDESPAEATLIQGFGNGWRLVDWALCCIATLPADVLEELAPIESLNAQRMGGGRLLSWSPLSIAALEQLSSDRIGLFIILLTGSRSVAERAEKWRSTADLPILHISSSGVKGTWHPENFLQSNLITHCREVLAKSTHYLDAVRLAAADEALAAWSPRIPKPSGVKAWMHNALLPNQMTLRRAGRSLEPGEPFISHDDATYDRLILDGARAVLAVREEAGIYEFHRIYLFQPELYLVEPSMFRRLYSAPGKKSRLDPSAAKIMAMFRTQTSIRMERGLDILTALKESKTAQIILGIRQQELQTFANGVGLAAAQTCSAVVRLSPAINRVFPTIKAFSNSIRSENPASVRKAGKLFTAIQDGLREAVGPEKLAFIKDEISGPIQIISDAPVEWLPIDGLPLMIRHQCSRINATPGNLLMGQLELTDVVTVPASFLQHILVVSAFAETDRLKDVMRRAIEIIRPSWEGKLKIEFATTTTVAGFVQVLNAFDGGIIIFDGHGSLGEEDKIGKLHIGREKLDVWSLRGTVRVAPIIILSACDTQGVDAGSHATAGNGFLALGAISVVATLLPVNGLSSASFIARLIFRLSDFIPAALAMKKRSISWLEVFWGMQLMLLASDLLDRLVGPISERDSPRNSIQLEANLDINRDDPAWYERLVKNIAALDASEVKTTEIRAHQVVAASDVIRYIQLGHPSNVVILNEVVANDLLPPFTELKLGREELDGR